MCQAGGSTEGFGAPQRWGLCVSTSNARPGVRAWAVRELLFPDVLRSHSLGVPGTGGGRGEHSHASG